MFALKLALFVVTVFILITEGKGKVGGSLGYGLFFNDNSVDSLGFTDNVADRNGCCSECKTTYPGTQMVNFYQEQSYKLCHCLKRKSLGQPPVTHEEGYFTGRCGSQSGDVNGGLGEGRAFLANSVDFQGYVDGVGDMKGCCQECGNKYRDTNIFANMFVFYEGETFCSCYRTIPGKTPVTIAKEYYADVCRK